MGGTSCEEAKRLVQSLLEDQVLVGFDLGCNDLKVLGLHPPPERVRDVQRYYTKEVCLKLALEGLPSHSGPYSLKYLTRAVFGVAIQGGAHNSAEDAMATMALWEYYSIVADLHSLPRKSLENMHVLPRYSFKIFKCM